MALYREALRLDPGDWDTKANLERLSAQREPQEADALMKQAAPSGDETAHGPRGSQGAAGDGDQDLRFRSRGSEGIEDPDL